MYTHIYITREFIGRKLTSGGRASRFGFGCFYDNAESLFITCEKIVLYSWRSLSRRNSRRPQRPKGVSASNPIIIWARNRGAESRGQLYAPMEGCDATVRWKKAVCISEERVRVVMQELEGTRSTQAARSSRACTISMGGSVAMDSVRGMDAVSCTIDAVRAMAKTRVSVEGVRVMSVCDHALEGMLRENDESSEHVIESDERRFVMSGLAHAMRSVAWHLEARGVAEVSPVAATDLEEARRGPQPDRSRPPRRSGLSDAGQTVDEVIVFCEQRGEMQGIYFRVTSPRGCDSLHNAQSSKCQVPSKSTLFYSPDQSSKCIFCGNRLLWAF